MGGVIGEKQADDLFLIQIRLFRLARINGISMKKSAASFLINIRFTIT